MLKPNFKRADIQKHIEKRMMAIEQEIIRRLHALGIQCVNMSRGEGNNSPQAFPVSYGKGTKKPLRQRLINATDKKRNPSVTAPAFGDFLDYSSNLRNSISYFIIKDGRVVDGDLGSQGAALSNQIATERARGMRKGYGLVVVAGQEYAEFVESQGFDVISSAELFAKNEMPKLIAKMKAAVKQK
jgi:hypothetical protein